MGWPCWSRRCYTRIPSLAIFSFSMAARPISLRSCSGTERVYARDDRPWGGVDPPAAVYFYSPDRKAARPIGHLQNFKGILQVDGYADFETLAGNGEVVLAACWAHGRWPSYESSRRSSALELEPAD